MSVSGPKKDEGQEIEVALLSTKDQTAVTVQIISTNEEPLTYAEIADILFELADNIAESKGDYLTDDTEEMRLN